MYPDPCNPKARPAERPGQVRLLAGLAEILRLILRAWAATAGLVPA